MNLSSKGMEGTSPKSATSPKSPKTPKSPMSPKSPKAGSVLDTSRSSVCGAQTRSPSSYPDYQQFEREWREQYEMILSDEQRSRMARLYDENMRIDRWNAIRTEWQQEQEQRRRANNESTRRSHDEQMQRWIAEFNHHLELEDQLFANFKRIRDEKQRELEKAEAERNRRAQYEQWKRVQDAQQAQENGDRMKSDAKGRRYDEMLTRTQQEGAEQLREQRRKRAEELQRTAEDMERERRFNDDQHMALQEGEAILAENTAKLWMHAEAMSEERRRMTAHRNEDLRQRAIEERQQREAEERQKKAAELRLQRLREVAWRKQIDPTPL